MKPQHIVAVACLCLAVAFAVAGQAKVAAGLFGLATFVEVLAAAIIGKKENT